MPELILNFTYLFIL